jgi:creatinine amidohydrolase
MKRLRLISTATALFLCCFSAAAQSPASVQLADLTHPEISGRDVRVLVLPIGSTEPHANHLCYGNDVWTAGALAARAAAKANEEGARVLVLPTMPFGINVNLTSIPYAQCIRPATMIQFVKDVIDTAEKQGIRKVLILNAHGGNTATLGAALRELYATHPKVFVAQVETSAPYREEVAKIVEKTGEHASEAETSVALALFPEKVRMERATRPSERELKLRSVKAANITFVRPWQYVSDTTGVGDPTRATAQKGQKLVSIFVDRISAFLKELSDAELTETFPY